MVHAEHGPRNPADYPETEFAGQDPAHPGWNAPTDLAPDCGEMSYQGHGLLKDKKALVTGGDSGVGRAVCLAFAREGAEVQFTYLPKEQDDAAATAHLVEHAGVKAVPMCCDIRKEEDCKTLVDWAVGECGRIDILVNNDDYRKAQPEGISAITTEQFEGVMRNNLYGMFWLTKYAVPHIPSGGCIINSASLQAYQPTPEFLDYAMTQGAVISFTRGLATALEPRGIRVNAIAPESGATPEKASRGKRPQPVDLVNAYVFLASPQARDVTAEIVNPLDGTPLS
jgi:NAD(P)-dependent dehydrogenase (short-subunit alcohol dehydrogenase family)